MIMALQKAQGKHFPRTANITVVAVVSECLLSVAHGTPIKQIQTNQLTKLMVKAVDFRSDLKIESEEDIYSSL